MPDTVWARFLSPQNVAHQEAGLNGPASDRFTRNVHATVQRQLPDLARAHIEPNLGPDNMSNDLAKKPVAIVADLSFCIDTAYAQINGPATSGPLT